MTKPKHNTNTPTDYDIASRPVAESGTLISYFVEIVFKPKSNYKIVKVFSIFLSVFINESG